jgi:hypothetical protein
MFSTQLAIPSEKLDSLCRIAMGKDVTTDFGVARVEIGRFDDEKFKLATGRTTSNGTVCQLTLTLTGSKDQIYFFAEYGNVRPTVAVYNPNPETREPDFLAVLNQTAENWFNS